MKTLTTLAALLFTACTVPGLQMGSTFSTSAPSGSAPASASAPASTPAPTTAPAPATATDSQSAARAADAISAREVQPIDGAARWLGQITSGKVVPGHGTRESELRDQVMYCSQQVANLVREYPRSAVLPLEHGKATVGDADATICQALAKAADGWDARSKQVYAAQNDALLVPYRNAGVAGDKLKLVDDLGKQLIGPGQAEPTPAIVARATALFSLRDEGPRIDGGHDWTIVRYAFAGNKQVAVTEKGYHDRPGPGAYR